MRSRLRVTLAVVIVVAGFAASHAERLPIAVYTMADGLARNGVGRIVQDSHGFIWFCSDEGLSRFDGTRFQVFGVDSGLPAPDVADLLETRDGAYWAAATAGIYRLDLTAAQPAGTAVLGQIAIQRPPQVTSDLAARVLYEGRDGALWVGTAMGLYRVDRRQDSLTWTPIELDCVNAQVFDAQINALVEDGGDALWIGTRGCGLQRRGADGAVHRVLPSAQAPATMVPALMLASDGSLWVGTNKGIAQVDPQSWDRSDGVLRWLSTRDGLPPDAVFAITQVADGTIYAGTRLGLVRISQPRAQGSLQLTTLGRANGLSEDAAISLAADREGNLWIGTLEAGAMKVTPSGFTGLGADDGLSGGVITALVSPESGSLLTLSRSKIDGALTVGELEAHRFRTTTLTQPRSSGGWGWGQTLLRDHAGALWVATAHGVRVYERDSDVRKMCLRPPTRTLTARDGLPGDGVFRIFEDSRGDVWISAAGPHSALARWVRSTQRIEGFADSAEYAGELPASFTETPDGAVWIGLYGFGVLYRWRDGHMRRFGAEHGVPHGGIHALHVDAHGALWVGSTLDGAAVCRDPRRDDPRFEPLRTAQGLSSNEVAAFAEDDAGRLYFGTGRGIDRLDPVTRRFRHYSTADGAPSGTVYLAARDRAGVLWFASGTQLARLIPTGETSRPIPAARIVTLRVGGVSQPLPPLGATSVSDLLLDSGPRSMEVEFLAPALRGDGELRYRHRLEGAEDGWSVPDTRRAVEYPLLAAGRYRLAVQAVGPDGTAGAAATVALRVLPPVWARTWFLALAAVVVVAGAWTWHRQRVARLVALERVRTRIATDLHDDVGASLSRTAILAEVVRRDVAGTNPEAAERLDQIARSAREVVDGMADIVWALDPSKDDLGQLVSRIRAFASEILPPSGARFSLRAPEDAATLSTSLDAEPRRQAYLVLKEAIANAARHADAKHVSITIKLRGGRLEAVVEDDGRGLAGGATAERSAFGGNGLRNMQARVARCRGTISLTSQPGQGTRIALSLPVNGGPATENA